MCMDGEVKARRRERSERQARRQSRLYYPYTRPIAKLSFLNVFQKRHILNITLNLRDGGHLFCNNGQKPTPYLQKY